jgi:biotin carboxylase/GNAT superfamily N-acetyltransferase
MDSSQHTRQILFVFGTQSCVPEDPLKAAKRLFCRPVIVAPRLPCGIPGDLIDRFERVSFRDPAEAIAAARSLNAVARLHAVVGYDDQAVPMVARIAAALGLPGHPVDAADAARDKLLMKEKFRAAGLPIASFHLASDEDDAVAWANATGYPAIIKPVRGSASQGVIRADDEDSLRGGYRRLRRIVRELGLDTGGRPDSEQLIETYLDGSEYSMELIVQNGVPEVFCEFEKPKPLCGPFFEETLYVTPTHLSAEASRGMRKLAVEAVQAVGLRQGVVHCEMRLCAGEPFLLELGARLIGGACSRVFRRILGEDIHRIVLQLALGEPVEAPRLEAGAAGAMMLPIPGEGRIRSVRGTDRARRVSGIDDVIVTAAPGDLLIPFPEQSCYIGFLTASGCCPEEVAAALETAASCIEFDVEPLTCEFWDREIRDHSSYVPPPRLAIRSLGEYSREEAHCIVLPIIAQTHFCEYPQALALEKAEECLRWVEEGNRGDTCPEVWLTSGDDGVALGSCEGDVCHASCIGVTPGRQRNGVGEALVESIMALFARRGCTRMRAWVDPRQPAALALFRHMGFERNTSVEQSCCACS